LKQSIKLLLLAIAALFVHGYHLGAGDSAIYVPAVKKAFNPQLYPFGAEFFMHHERLSIFSPLVAGSARLFHLPIDTVIFLWYVFCLFLLMAAGWRIACLCFSSTRARWAAVSLLAALLTVPVAGTALVISDPYLTARSLSTPAAIFAIDAFLRERKASTVFWLILTILVHPQMAAFVVGLMFFLYWTDRRSNSRSGVKEPEASMSTAAGAAILSRWPQGFNFHPAQGPYREVLDSRTFFFAYLWHWYEWVGALVPLGILYVFARIRPRGTLPAFQRICRALVPFGILATVGFIVLSATQYLDNFVRLQPMRAFHILYLLFFLLLGGLAGEYVLKARVWRWAALFVPLAIGMFAVNKSMYASSRAIEWPGAKPKNAWVSAFQWVRNNTPQNAVFALDPRYLLVPGEDRHGFRAIADRSQIADALKDSGAVSLFPQLTADWVKQQEAQRGFEHFTLADFKRLASETPVTWVLVQRPPPIGMACPYRNNAVTVCRIPEPDSGK
jgi:hypothetical protein